MRNPHRFIITIDAAQPPRYLLRRPAQLELRFNNCAQRRVQRELRELWPPRTIPGGRFSVLGAVARPPAIAVHLARDHGVAARDPDSDRPEALAASQAARDLLTLCLCQTTHHRVHHLHSPGSQASRPDVQMVRRSIETTRESDSAACAPSRVSDRSGRWTATIAGNRPESARIRPGASAVTEEQTSDFVVLTAICCGRRQAPAVCRSACPARCGGGLPIRRTDDRGARFSPGRGGGSV